MAASAHAVVDDTDDSAGQVRVYLWALHCEQVVSLSATRLQLFGVGSVVMSYAEGCELSKELSALGVKSCELRYRASRDGYSAKAHHDRCYGQGALLTVVKDVTGKVFGGYYARPGGKTLMFRAQYGQMRLYNSCSVYGQRLAHAPISVTFGGATMSADLERGVNDDDNEEDARGFLCPYRFKPLDVETWVVSV